MSTRGWAAQATINSDPPQASWARVRIDDEIYVVPTRRRRGIASKVLISAGLYAVAAGRPRIWGGGERTDMGEALVTEGPELFPRSGETQDPGAASQRLECRERGGAECPTARDLAAAGGL